MSRVRAFCSLLLGLLFLGAAGWAALKLLGAILRFLMRF